MFTLEGNEDGFFVCIDELTDQILHAPEMCIFDECEVVHLVELGCLGIRVHLDGERALRAILSVLGEFKLNLGSSYATRIQ